MGKVIGIDLGTTYSAVSYLKGKTPEIIPDKNGKRNMSSIICIQENSIAVGEEAKQLEMSYPETTIKRIKRKNGNGL